MSADVPPHARACDPLFHSCPPRAASASLQAICWLSPPLFNFSHNTKIWWLCGLVAGWMNRDHAPPKSCQSLFRTGPGALDVVWIPEACTSPWCVEHSTPNRYFQRAMTKPHFPLICSGIHLLFPYEHWLTNSPVLSYSI